MNRQLYANGGIMQLAPREKFGIGSKLKKFVRKIIPNEVADIAVKAAPFVAPFNPALAGAMAGIGTFDQTGSIGDSLKRGALTYGGGQLARYAGGAGFQGNPFASGGAFTPSGFTSGFSSPIGRETGLGKFFSNRGTQPVSGVGEVDYSDMSKFNELGLGGSGGAANIQGGIPSANVFDYESAAYGIEPLETSKFTDLVNKQALEKIDPKKIAETVTKETITGSPKQMSITESIQKIVSPDSTLGERGTEALNLLKRGTKAAFTNKDGSVDKAAVMGAVAFASSYLEARALAADAGIDLTQAEYDEATKAEKKEEYASYLTDFFAGKKDGGRIGFKQGSPKEPSEIGIMTIDVEAGDDEDEEDIDNLMAGITFSSAEKSYLFRRLGGAGGASRSYTMPQLYKILNNPGAYPGDARALKRITIGLGIGKKDGGRIGLKDGTDEKLKEILEMDMTIPKNPNDPRNMTTNEIIFAIQDGRSTPEMFEELLLRDVGGIDTLMLDEIGGKKFDEPKKVYTFNPSESSQGGVIEDFLFKLRESNPDIYGEYFRPSLEKDRGYRDKPLMAKGGRIGYSGGANRVSELLVLRDGILAKDADADVSDIDAEIFQLTGKVFRSVGGIGDVPTGNLRRNKVGVIERDYRDEGGFVPVGVKERADDVPAMLSKNEFVMTADAVRGIGGGDVEKGSKRLYNTMKQAEKVGRA